MAVLSPKNSLRVKGHDGEAAATRRAGVLLFSIIVVSSVCLISLPTERLVFPVELDQDSYSAAGGIRRGIQTGDLTEFTRFLEDSPKVHRRKTRRQRAVACAGGDSVGCVARGALEGIESGLMRRSRRHTPGEEEVEAAARGRGFKAWPMRRFNGGKEEEEGREKVAMASRSRPENGIEGAFDSMWKGYLKLDQSIDGGWGRKQLRRSKTVDGRRSARNDLEASIEALKKEKAQLSQTLADDAAKSKKVRAVGKVKKAGEGWFTDGRDWLGGGGDVVANDRPWGY